MIIHNKFFTTIILFLLLFQVSGMQMNLSAATIRRETNDHYILSNSKLERVIEVIKGKSFQTLRCTNILSGETLKLDSEEFSLVTDSGELSGNDFKVTEVKIHQDKEDASLNILLKSKSWKASVKYELRGDQHFDTRYLTLEYSGMEPTLLNRIWIGSYRANNTTRIHKTFTSSSDTCAYLRQKQGGALINVDFPYSEIEIQENRVRLGYALEDRVETGYIHEAESLNMGVYTLEGVHVGTGGGASIDFELENGSWMTKTTTTEGSINLESPDRGEIRAFREMYEILAPNRRGTSQIHYQSYDDMDMRREQASIMDRPESLYKEMDLAAEWGFNSYGMYEDHNVFLPDRPPLNVVKEVSEYAGKKDLLFGSGNPCNLGTGFFWKSEPTKWDHPEWAYLNEKGERDKNLIQCWAAPGFIDYLLERDVDWIRDYNWSSFGFDFFIVNPCFDPNHNHPLGKASFYKQMKAAVEYHSRIRESSNDPENFFIQSWLGYEPWLPKFGKWCDFFYMTDPANTWPIPAANLHEQMLADYRRMFWRLFLEHGVPGYMLQNPIFLANWRSGLIRDAEMYQNNFIALFGLSPNINIQQPLRFLDSLTVKEYEEANNFFKKWFKYTKDNFDILRNLIVLSPSPAPGVLEMYGHPSKAGDKCILVLVNVNFFRMEKVLPISELIGLKDTGKAWLIRERFPSERWSVIDGRTQWDWNEGVRISVPPKTTMLHEIVPETPVKRGQMRWYGLPEKISNKIDKNLWQFKEEQAKTYQVALELPEGHYISSVKTRDPEPKGVFENIEVNYRDRCTHFNFTFPSYILNDPVQREITDWVVQPGSLNEGIRNEWTKGIEGKPTRFPLDSILEAQDHNLLMTDPGSILYEGKNIGKFMGTMMYNPWYWNMLLEVELEIAKGAFPKDSSEPQVFPVLKEATGRRQFEDYSEYWLSTNLNQMAVQNRLMGYTPYFSEHMFIPLPFVDYENIEQIKAWINGIPALVEKLDYLMVPPFGKFHEHGTYKFLYYLDGSKNNLKVNFWDSTPNNITIWVKWKG